MKSRRFDQVSGDFEPEISSESDAFYIRNVCSENNFSNESGYLSLFYHTSF